MTEERATRPRKTVIVGGVAGGMSTATRLRRDDELRPIVVFERGAYVSFANCGLPYHLSGVIEDRESLLLTSPSELEARFGFEVRVRHQVEAIHRDRHVVVVRDLDLDVVFEQPYDSLVLATGASPVRPPLPGFDRALSLRDVTDLDAIMKALANGPARTAAVLGGGFIGLELAENLVRRGLSVTLVEMADQVLAPLDPEMAAIVEQRLIDNGVDVRTGRAATEVTADAVRLDDDTLVPGDLVFASIGVTPASSLARDAGLDLGPRGGILVDDSQRTSDPDVFAVGDAALKRDAISGEPTMVPLAQTANRHGRLVADAITGRPVRARPVLGTAVVGVFDLAVATVGWNEKALRAAGRPYRAIHTHPYSHAGYYPGADLMALKLLVDPETGAILGAQGVGGSGVDKRIDIIATAMRGGLRASDLADLELAYAPQFGSAKDPVNMLGLVADNLAAGFTRTIQWHEVPAEQAGGSTFLDVRTDDEVADGMIPGALHLPIDELRARLDEIPDGRIVIYCAAGQRAHTAARMLAQRGHDVVNLDGGYATWSIAPAPTGS